MDLLDNAQIQEAQGQYLKFLDDKDDKEHYQQVKTMIEKKSQRLIINMGESSLYSLFSSRHTIGESISSLGKVPI